MMIVGDSWLDLARGMREAALPDTAYLVYPPCNGHPYSLPHPFS